MLNFRWHREWNPPQPAINRYPQIARISSAKMAAHVIAILIQSCIGNRRATSELRTSAKAMPNHRISAPASIVIAAPPARHRPAPATPHGQEGKSVEVRVDLEFCRYTTTLKTK